MHWRGATGIGPQAGRLREAEWGGRLVGVQAGRVGTVRVAWHYASDPRLAWLMGEGIDWRGHYAIPQHGGEGGV